MNAGSSSSASTRASSSGSRSSSAGSDNSHGDGRSPIVRNMVASITSSREVEAILPFRPLAVTYRPRGSSGRSKLVFGPAPVLVVAFELVVIDNEGRTVFHATGIRPNDQP